MLLLYHFCSRNQSSGNSTILLFVVWFLEGTRAFQKAKNPIFAFWGDKKGTMDIDTINWWFKKNKEMATNETNN